MRENLQKEIILIAGRIVQNASNINNTETLLQDVRTLHERVTILDFLVKNNGIMLGKPIQNIPVTPTPSQETSVNVPVFQMKKPLSTSGVDETLLQQIRSNPPIPNPQPIVPPRRNEDGEGLKSVFEKLASETMPFQPSVKEEVTPSKTIANSVPPPPKTINDLPTNQIQLGLNDRLAFISHLFNGNDKHFSETITLLNSIDDIHYAVRYVQEEIKPAYNQWQGKESYEERFMLAILRKFN